METQMKKRQLKTESLMGYPLKKTVTRLRIRKTPEWETLFNIFRHKSKPPYKRRYHGK